MNKKKILICGWRGYIGYALTQRLLNKNYEVYGVDNYQRENAVDELNSTSASNLDFEYIKSFKNFKWKTLDISNSYDELDKIVGEFKPDTIMNLAHIPSAPYSLIDQQHADLTILNNIRGTNNLLWSVKTHVPNCHYITIGTAGEYNHYANIDVEEGYFKFEHKGRQSTECIFPRRPGSIYHTTKVASTYLIDLLAKSWNIRCTDIMQGVVFGLYTDEADTSKKYTRFDSDECFGTVINRFCTQAVLGEPLTVYGEGKHQRTFLSLNDSLQALEIAINNPAEKGKVQVWNQLSEWHSMNDLADKVIQAAKKLGFKDVNKQNIPTPRTEHTGEHYYKFITEKLTNLGYKPTRSIEEEIEYTLKHLQTSITSDKVYRLRGVIKPKITWK